MSEQEDQQNQEQEDQQAQEQDDQLVQYNQQVQEQPTIETTRKATSLVRLLLAHQQSGITLKREDITKHVDVTSRTFSSIMNLANVMLRGTFNPSG